MKPLFSLLLFSSALCALTLDEALQRAEQNSHQLQRQAALSNVKSAQYDGAYSAYKPTLDFSYSYTRSDTANYIGSKTDSSASLELGYNLFNGFSDKYGIEVARLAHQASRHEYDALKADMKLNVKRAYITVLREEKALEVAEESMALLDKQLFDAKAFFGQGLTAKNDYLQIELEHLGARQELLRRQSALKMAKEGLRRVLSGAYDLHEPLKPLHYTAREFSKAALETAMEQQRSELQALRANLRENDARISRLKGNYYPTVDGTLKYQKAGTDVWPDGGQNFKSNDETSMNISVDWQLYAGGSVEAARTALLEERSALHHALKDLELTLKLQLEQAVEAYRLAQAQLGVADKGVEQAKEHYRITKNQYDARIADAALLLDAKRSLTASQLTYHNAYFDLFDAVAVIERITQSAPR